MTERDDSGSGAGSGSGSAEAPEQGGSPRSLMRTTVRGVSIAGIGYGLTQIINLGSYLVLARLLTPDEFGVFAAATIIAGVGMVLGESGMLAALIQRREQVDEAFNSALLATLGGGLLLSLAILATAPLVGLFFDDGQVEAVAAAMSGWLLLRMATIVPDAHLQRRFSFIRRVVVDPLAVIAFAAGAITAGAAGLGVWALVIGTYASAATKTIASWAFARWRPRPRLASVAIWRELARFGRPVVGAELIRRVTSEMPTALLGRFAGANALGQMSYAMRVAAQPLGAVINAGGYVLLPVFARISAEDERFKAAFLRALRWQSVIAFPSSLLFIPLGVPAIVLVFGEEWRDAGYAAMALSGYCAALSLDSIASEAWKARGRTELLPRMHGIALVLTVVFAGALTPPFGLIGCCIGLTLAAFGVAAYAIWGVGEVLRIPLRTLLAQLWPATAASLVMAGAVTALEFLVVQAADRGLVAGLLLLAFETVVAAAIYVAVLSLLAPQTGRELRAVAGRLLARVTRRGRERAAGA